MRFSILALLIVTAIVAVFCVAFLQQTVVWVLVTGTLAYLLVLWSALKAWNGGGRQKETWRGFVVGSLVYLFLFSATWMLPRYIWVLAVRPVTFAQIGLGEKHHIVAIYQHAFCIGFGVAGARIGFVMGRAPRPAE